MGNVIFCSWHDTNSNEPNPHSSIVEKLVCFFIISIFGCKVRKKKAKMVYVLKKNCIFAQWFYLIQSLS